MSSEFTNTPSSVSGAALPGKLHTEMNLIEDAQKTAEQSKNNSEAHTGAPNLSIGNNGSPWAGTFSATATAGNFSTTETDTQNNDSSSDIDQIFSESSRSNINEEQILLAATLVRDAVSNRYLDFKSDKQSLKLYILYHNAIFKYVQYFMIFVILGIACFEVPAIVEAPYWATQIVELVAYCYLGFRVIHLASFQHKTSFWKDKKNATAIILLLLCIIDIICYSCWRSAAPKKNPVRWSRPLRPLFIINFPQARQIRRAFRNIRKTVVEIIFVLILFFFSIMIFALMALKLMDSRDIVKLNGDPYFQTYGDALWELYVLVTTANNPDVMMPAYEINQGYPLFFIIFLIVNLYIFMNVLLAVIFNSYKNNLKNEVRDAVYSKRKKLAAAYDVAKEPTADNSGYSITIHTWARVLKTMYPKTSAEKVKMYFQVMDEHGDGHIKKASFLQVADILNIPLTQVKDRMIEWEKLCPSLFNSPPSKAVRMVCLHRFYRYFFDFAIVVNAIFIAIPNMEEAEWFFLALFTLEIFLNFYVFGPRKFITSFWNVTFTGVFLYFIAYGLTARKDLLTVWKDMLTEWKDILTRLERQTTLGREFDVIVIGSAVVATITEQAGGISRAQGDTLDFILVMRVLRLIKIVNGFDRFRIVVETLIAIGPSIMIYGGVVFTFYYTFSIIGMEVFHDKMEYYGANTYNQSKLADPSKWYCGNPKLEKSEYYALHYCSNNFNHIWRAFVLLTELTVVNQWHVLVEGFEKVTHPAVRVYFVLFHLSVVVLIMNIFIAFILEAFLLEYSLSKSKIECNFETKILKLGYGLGQKKLEVPGTRKPSDSESIVTDMEGAAEEGPRFHVNQRRRKVEVLLQRMFEDELDPEDIGAEEGLADDEDQPPRRYSFHMFGAI